MHNYFSHQPTSKQIQIEEVSTGKIQYEVTFSYFTDPRAIPNLYSIIFFFDYKRRNLEPVSSGSFTMKE